MECLDVVGVSRGRVVVGVSGGRGVSAGKSDRSDFGEIYSEKSLGSRSIRDRTGLAVLSLCICVVTPNTMGTVDVLFPDRGA